MKQGGRDNTPKRKVYAILTSAGSGSRFSKTQSGRQIQKQFIKVKGLEIFLYPLLVLQECSSVDEIVVTAENKYFDMIHRLSVKNEITKLTALVEGGKTRSQSVRNAVLMIDAGPEDLVLIHDAVRPRIDHSFVESIIKAAKLFGEVIPGVKLTDTIKRDSSGYVKETLSRENLWAIQTPQVFRYKVLIDSYKKAKGKKDFTDESALIENARHKVKIIAGSKDNIKITTAEDLITFKRMLGTR
jgi:2-C-methyl-D-erythritol 4-phosphate cytidylyltransferase